MTAVARIWHAPYLLRARGSLGARAAGRERSGSLIRVEGQGWIGHADVHPWPELGDEPLAKQLASLAEGRPLALAERSLEHARRDGEARSQGLSAFAGLSVPDSHFLAPSLGALTPEFAGGLRRRSLRAVKAKIDLASDGPRAVAGAAEACAGAGLRLRLDANAAASAQAFLALWSALPNGAREAIEFVEDPCPWSEADWRALADAGVPAAFDRPLDDRARADAALAQADERGLASTVVLKPAGQDASALARRTSRVRVAITSYLDHPVGQASAALEAARLGRELLARGQGSRLAECGLLSQGAYEPNEFSEALPEGPEWRAPEGTGLGFDALLARAPWRRLR